MRRGGGKEEEEEEEEVFCSADYPRYVLRMQ